MDYDYSFDMVSLMLGEIERLYRSGGPRGHNLAQPYYKILLRIVDEDKIKNSSTIILKETAERYMREMKVNTDKRQMY